MKITYLSCRNPNCGIGRYTSELANYIYEQEDVILYRKGRGEEPFVKAYPHRSFKSLKDYIAPYYLYQAIKQEESNLWHADYPDASTSFGMAKHKKGKLVTTVHDAIPYIFYQNTINFSFYKYNMIQAAKHSDAFIVVSENAKDDLLYHTRIKAEKIHVIYNGINHEMFYPDKIKQENEVFTIRYIGGLVAPHKNARALIEIARILESRNIEYKLEIGSGVGSNTDLFKLIKKYKIKNIEFSGFIPDHKLREFLAGADLFIYPSLYEGFGFPPLEAMACGTPVISSNCGSLPEVLGKAAYVVGPDAKTFADAIEDVIYSKKLRTELREKGIKQAAKYHWSKTANKTLMLYQNIL